MSAVAGGKSLPAEVADRIVHHSDGIPLFIEEVCRRLKANPRTTDIPVVMVTALSDIADRLRGLEAGADDFLTKPVNDIALFARVRSLVRLKRMMEELRLDLEVTLNEATRIAYAMVGRP